jgi:hypothetical protein
MSILDETRFIERFQFFNGQRLFASDLQGADDFNREMRWLHNRSLHQAGIGSGFAVQGNKGDREVWIGAGYALDAEGREIVLTNTMSLQVPPVAGDDAGAPIFYDLAVSYPDDASLEETETREGICAQRGVVRRREVPVFCWIRLDTNGQPIDVRLKEEVRKGMRIILARAEVLNCQLNRDLSIAERRSALPPRLPHIICGEERPTAWDMYILEPEMTVGMGGQGDLGAFVSPVGITAKVDTSAAAFQVTPCYTARFNGPRVMTIERGESQLTFAIDAMISIRNEEPASFEIDLLLVVQPFQRFFTPGGNLATEMFFSVSGSPPGLPSPNDPFFRAAFLKLFEPWHVVWMGVEG